MRAGEIEKFPFIDDGYGSGVAGGTRTNVINERVITTESTNRCWAVRCSVYVIGKSYGKHNAALIWLSDGDNLLLVLTLLGVATGAALGFVLRQCQLSDTTVLLVGFPGDLLMQLLKCVIVPMIIASICSSVVQLEPRQAGRMGLLTLLYYCCTTALAVSITVLVATLVQPGLYAEMPLLSDVSHRPDVDRSQRTKQTLDMLLDFFRRLVPDNAFRVPLQQVDTQLTQDDSGQVHRRLVFVDNPNILGVVTCSIAFGLAVAATGVQAAPLAQLLVALNVTINKLVTNLMWLLPLGVVSLVAGSIVELQADASSIVQALLTFVLCSCAAQTLHFYVLLPLLYLVVVRRNPYRFLQNQLPAYATTIGHSSSTAALPITLHCIENRNHVDSRVAQFCLPVGAAINVDGAALYEALAVVFVGQMHRMDLDVGQIIAIIVTVTVSSVGSSGLPGAGLISVLPLIAPIKVTYTDVAMLIVVDWFVDRYRTANNVMGDSIGAAIVAKLCGAS